MYYKKKEDYSFSMPREYYAYLAFKEKLKELGVNYMEEGGHTQGTITIVERGTFDVDKNSNILSMVKEEK